MKSLVPSPQSLVPRIVDPSVTRHILKKFKLRAVKGLGQNFLIDADIVRGIVEAADICAGDEVLEIGPGIGTLTQGLLEAGAFVTAVEVDKKLPAVLKETLAGYENFRLVEGDILKINLAKLMPRRFKVVANLPYYITTQILLTLLEKDLPAIKIVTMVQREVAERMTVAPGSKIYGALSVAVQFRSEPRIAFDVPPESFLPSPEVTSSVVVCDVRKPPVAVDEDFFFKVVRTAFAQRRKTLLNSLASFGKEKLLTSGIDVKRRAETLSLEEFAALATALQK
ncbi:MAG: 16S rRNA (adenine(1518)-N(6)/adenine(1519)-N(6))-dimethyltransferase RsmA [Selenomonadaceae bacterium]|nr:16S rRNA (adenine(1518)-N(6)/adenine(1519)-N(6))-dimethyltransferase RsmA [Selenomonadaceae bacterium]